MLQFIGEVLQRTILAARLAARAGAAPALLVLLVVGVVPALAGQALAGQAPPG